MNIEYYSYDQLPLVMNATHIASALGISRPYAYQLMHRDDFPTVYVGKRILVPKDKFITWLDNHTTSKIIITY